MTSTQHTKTILASFLILLLAFILFTPQTFAANFGLDERRVELEVDTPDGDKETITIVPESVPFEAARFVQAAVSAESTAIAGAAELSELGDSSRDKCPDFQAQYLAIISAPAFVNTPAQYTDLVARYERAIQIIADGARNFYLYCVNGGGFSDFNYFLATSGYSEGVALLDGVAREALEKLGASEAAPPPPPPAEPPVDTPSEPPTEPDPVEPEADSFPGTELYFGDTYPKAEPRATLFIKQADGTTSEVGISPNIVPFNGNDFTTVTIVSTAFLDFMRLEVLSSMGGGSSDRCDDLIGAYTILSLSPMFDDVPAQHQLRTTSVV